MDLLYFLKVFYRKKWVIAALAVLAMLTTLFLLLEKRSEYTSIAQYSTGFTSERVKLVDGTTTLDLYTIDLKFDNVIETIKSPEVLSRISYSLLLHDISDPSTAYKKLSEQDRSKPVFSAIDKDTAKAVLSQKLARNELLQSNIETEKDILEYLKLYGYDYSSLLEDLAVNRVARTDYLDISFSSVNPDLSAFVVNSIGLEFLNYYKSLSQRRTTENAQNIKDLLLGQQGKVDSLGQLLLDEKVRQGTIDPLSRTKSAMETVTELESRLADERGKYNQHLNRYKYLTSRLDDLQSSANTGGANDAYIALVNKRNSLVEQLNRKGGRDNDLEKQISDLRTEITNRAVQGIGKAKLKDAIDDVTAAVNEENALLNASKSTINEYESSINRYMGMTNSNPGSEIKMNVIQTQLDMENKQLGNLKEISSQIAGLAKDDPTSNFIQTRIGQASIQPNPKRILLKMGLAGMSVFFLSCVFFVFLEIFNSSVKTPTIFSKLSKSKVVSVVNKVNLKRKSATSIVQDETVGRKYRKDEVFKNNIRKLRFEVLNSGKKIFLFTSAQSNTGKSTIIEALASSLILSDKKVLIVDMNFSKNSLTRFFSTEVYVRDIVKKIDLSLPAHKDGLAGRTDFEKLHIVGCMEGNTTPFEAFNSTDIVDFFSYAKMRYDVILVEGASLNNHADSRELAQYVEGIFTVFAADFSLLQADRESTKFISELKDKYHGVILNRVLTENINS